MRDFLWNWPQKDSTDPKVQKIRKKYEKRNPAQMYKRSVKYANGIFEDLRYLFLCLPENYLNQIDIEKGLRYLYLEENQAKSSNNIRLRVALAQTTAGLHTLRQILREDILLDNMFRKKLFEMEFIANLLYEIATGKIMLDKKSKKERDRKLTKIFDEYHKSGIV